MRNEAMQYFDFFGTTYNFYTNSKSKLYTILGCILSIISIIHCLLVFFFIISDDIFRKTPTVTISSIHIIKLNSEQKIWLPLRIVDYVNKYLNHSGIIIS